MSLRPRIEKNPGDFILEQNNLTYTVVGGIARRNSTCNFCSKARIKDQTECRYKTKLGTKICRFPRAPLAWLGTTNMLELEWVHTTYKHQNDLLCTCMHSNTANLSEPTACMNCSVTSTLPRTWQDIIRSLGPHHRLQLATVYKKVYLGVKTIALPPSKPTVVFALNEGDNEITLLDVF